jgi:hypothetical protein
MSDAGRTDEYAPNSDLDRDEGQMICIIDGNGVPRKIYVNDFVDLSDVIPADPIWGSSFQVHSFEGNNIFVKMYNSESDIYELICVSSELILNNYKREPNALEEELT